MFVKKLIVVMVILTGVTAFFLVRPVLVLDSKSYLPISGAKVSMNSFGWDGCRPASETHTFAGFSFSFGIIFPCQLEVSKNNYHISGSNDPSPFPGFLGWEIVKLKRISSKPQQAIVFDRMFTMKKPGMDVTAYRHNINPNVEPDDLLPESQNDFVFTEIINEGAVDNAYGHFRMRMHFDALGGVQPISSNEAPGSDAGALYFDLQNLTEAPRDGYKQDLDIESGRAYVARLKDGVHFLKFHVFSFTEGDSRGEPFACMTGYLQSEPGNNIEFVNISGNHFCSNDRNPSNYDQKIKYLKIKEGALKEDTITNISSYRNEITIYTKGDPEQPYYMIASNNKYSSKNNSPINIQELIGKRATLHPPTFSNFLEKGKDASYTLFINGEYIDPNRIQ